MSGRIDLRKQVSLAATPERAFAALVEPGQITRFWPFREVVSSAVVGGPIVFSGEVDGVPFTVHGVIEAWDAPRHFRYRYWSDNHGTARLPENHMAIDYLLVPETEGCCLVVTHENLMSGERAAMMDGVWDYLLSQLRAHLAQGEGGSIPR